MENPNYYAMIPANVRYDKSLKPNEKLLYGEITALSNKMGYCIAKNSYFANLYSVHKKTISDWISNLKDKGYIDVELIYDDKEIVERRLYLSMKSRRGYPRKHGDPIHKITEVIIIQVLIINKKKKKKIKKVQMKIFLFQIMMRLFVFMKIIFV